MHYSYKLIQILCGYLCHNACHFRMFACELHLILLEIIFILFQHFLYSVQYIDSIIHNKIACAYHPQMYVCWSYLLL